MRATIEEAKELYLDGLLLEEDGNLVLRWEDADGLFVILRGLSMTAVRLMRVELETDLARGPAEKALRSAALKIRKEKNE
jgi:hypothetical protein